jgi:hypothetical protein
MRSSRSQPIWQAAKVLKGTAFGDNDDVLVPGDEVPASAVNEMGGPGPVGSGSSGDQSLATGRPILNADPASAETKANPVKGRPKRSSNSGGFKVDFRDMGVEEARAKYERDNRTIYVNLEHPQIASAKQRAGLEDPSFRRLAFEVAFAEYAIALASEMAGAGHYVDIIDPITDIRATINRLAVAGAKLYA